MLTAEVNNAVPFKSAIWMKVISVKEITTSGLIRMEIAYLLGLLMLMMETGQLSCIFEK